MRGKAEIGILKMHRTQGFAHCLQHFAVKDQLFEIGYQPALAPSGSMIDQVAMAGDCPHIAICVSQTAWASAALDGLQALVM